MKLEDIGWNSFFEDQYAVWSGSGLIPGRVTGEAGHLYSVETEKGRSDARISGHFQYTAAGPGDYPAVGDWVLMRSESDPMIIEKILERGSVFSRRAAGKRSDEQVIAANIDIMFIVAALDGGRNFTQRGLERYIVMVSDGGAEPVIILNKCDLCSESERAEFKTMAASVSGNIPVFMVSALTGEGIEQMNGLLVQGVTAAFTGPSGAGKSALINQLMGRGVQKTGSLREDDKRGRHTTTRKELFLLGSGAMVIDTPGLRELRPYGDTESLDAAFTEIAHAADSCRFKDCTHTDEPGCGVLGLVSEGLIEYERYQSYITIRGEIESFSMMKSEKGRMARKAKEKTLSKIIKNYNRDFKQ
ncbi:MAG: ribosome small subunit-dependent GTPase A [Spirochaetae bacterium HGW-Spirochaetae-5]|nr:MAG: ribosome small subunit-dependent GTPase A [Spirochaetae bacterium HGW-Spirochaetae-5]